MAQPSYERQPKGLQMPETLTSITSIGKMSGQKPKRSRLELMRQNYEKKRQKDVEDRLAEMRLQQARENSGKVKSGGTVRAFFAERRAMEANMKDPYALPPIDRHFRKVKDSSSSAPPRQAGAFESYTPPAHHKSKSAGRRRPEPQYYHKKSKGVDKQNPLPPLQRGKISSHKPPTPNKRYETHHILTGDHSQDDNNNEDEAIHQETVHVPKPPQQQNPLRKQRSGIESRSDFDESCSNYSEEPPPNLAKLKAIRQKRLSKQLSLVKQESIEKPTEFQKWQMEQDKQRAERLEKHKQKTTNTQSETEVTLSTRERELLKKIKAEQDKLKEIKRLQQELEEQERMESEEGYSHEFSIAEKEHKYSKKIDSFNEERKPEKVHIEYPRSDTKTEDISQVHIQKKKEKIKQMTIKRTLTPDEGPVQEDIDEPKEDFTAFYEQAAENDEAVSLDLSACSICGRKFATERLARHEKICNKNSKSKRKAFDVQRVSGMEHAKYVLSGVYKKEPPKPKKADWRVQHENFIKTIRYAKGASDEPPPVMENPHYVACPYCKRKFNPETAERHIPRCKDIKSRPAPPKANRRKR